LAEFGHSDWNGGILCKKQKNSTKIGMVGSYAFVVFNNYTTSISYSCITAPIAKVISALAVIEVFDVPGSNPTRRQHLTFLLRNVRVG